MRGEPPVPPSSRVRLEVAFLDDDQAAPAPTPELSEGDERVRITVLVVAGEADVRRYVRECLRSRSDLRILEAATVHAAVALAGKESPELLIVDEAERDVVVRLSQIEAIVIVDDLPYGTRSDARVRLLSRPFSAEQLMALVGRFNSR